MRALSGEERRERERVLTLLLLLLPQNVQPAMGNAQQRPPGRGDGGGGQRSQPGHPGQGRGRGESAKPPGPGKAPVMNGTQRDNRSHSAEESSPTGPAQPEEDKSYLDAPAGALPPHLARLKNEGNMLFKNGQFGDALEKYSQAITGCEEAGKVASPLYFEICEGT